MDNLDNLSAYELFVSKEKINPVRYYEALCNAIVREYTFQGHCMMIYVICENIDKYRGYGHTYNLDILTYYAIQDAKCLLSEKEREYGSKTIENRVKNEKNFLKIKGMLFIREIFSLIENGTRVYWSKKTINNT